MILLLRILFLPVVGLGMVLFVLWGGKLLTPDTAGLADRQVSPDQLAELQALRNPVLHPDNPPVFWKDVDYREGRKASWWPQGEPDWMEELVEDGTFPPVEERVGSEPMVVSGPDGIGQYGGSWLRVFTGSNVEYVVTSYIGGSTLVRWSPEGYPIVPNVARDWEHSGDFRNWTLHLRKGMKWSDGHLFTADDILYFFYHLYPVWRTGQTPNILMHHGEVGKVEKLDEHTVRFTYPDPHPLFLEKLAREPYYCAPEHYLGSYVPEPGEDPESNPLLQKAMKQTSLGTVSNLIDFLVSTDNPEHPRLWPWVFRYHSPSSPKVMVRNPYYWAVDEAGNQLPYLNEVVFQNHSIEMVPSVAASGGITFQFRNIKFRDYTLLMSERDQASPPYRVLHWYPGERSAYTLFPNLNRNLNPNDPGSANKAELLARRKFRQALSLAINRRNIIKAQFKGVGEPAQLAPGPDSAYHSPKLQNAYTEFDPEEANRLLDGLGLAQRDPHGYRTAPDGTNLTFFLHFDNQIGRGPVDLIVSDWAGVGIRAIPRERFSNLLINEREAGHTDFFVWFGAGEMVPFAEPRSFVPISSHSYQFSGYGRWYDLGGFYGDPDAVGKKGVKPPPEDSPAYRAIELLEEARVSPDPARREACMREILAINAEQTWSISICTPPPVLVVVDKDLRNVPEVAVQTYVFHSPNNVPKEAFYFATDTFPSGKPRESEAKIAQLKEVVSTVVPHPELAGVSMSNPLPRSSLPGFIKGLLAAILLMLVILLSVRHPYIGKRLLIMFPTLGVISVIVFMIIQLPPGDFIETYISKLEAEGEVTSYERIEKLREMFWLDEPMAVRYLNWMGLKWFVTFDSADKGLLQGDLGRSMASQRKVGKQVGDRILLTVLISAGTILFTWSLAIPIGIYSAVRQYSIGDYIFTFLGFIGMCVPGFLLALTLSYLGKVVFGIQMTGLLSPEYAAVPGWPPGKILDLLQHIWVPVVVMGITGTAGMIRVMRGNLLDELKKPYVVTARAKGVRPFKLLMKYPVRLALNPFISTIGGLFPQLISGGAIVAVVLSLPTVGPRLLESLLVEDMYFAGSMLMVLSLLGVLGTLVSDLALLALDPRIRFENSKG